MIEPSKLERLIADCLDSFYKHRLEKIKSIRLNRILVRKNPYLFRALATERAGDIVQQIMLAFLSSSDETIFGNDFFEPIARAVSQGHASDAKGVDLTVEATDTVTAYAIKSGTNALNASALAKQALEFDELRSRLFKLHKKFDPVLAAAYGRKCLDPQGRRTYRVVAGQRFWTELTGDSEFYLRLITLMRDIPERHKEAYKPEWDAAVNRLTNEFFVEFCHGDGRINWERLVAFVSAENPPALSTSNRRRPRL